MEEVVHKDVTSARSGTVPHRRLQPRPSHLNVATQNASRDNLHRHQVSVKFPGQTSHVETIDSPSRQNHGRRSFAAGGLGVFPDLWQSTVLFSHSLQIPKT